MDSSSSTRAIHDLDLCWNLGSVCLVCSFSFDEEWRFVDVRI